MLPKRQPLWFGLVIFIGAAAVMAGCAKDDEGEFTLSGFERFEECLSEASPMRPEMFAARDNSDSVSVSMQTDYRLPSTSDRVHIVVYQPDHVRERLGEPIELADPLELFQDDEEFDEPPVVRAGIAFNETCPDIQESLGLRGAVVFEELDAERGGRVSGRLVDAEALSLRHEQIIVEQVEGFWDFEVRHKRPHKFFPDYDDEPTRGPAP